MFFFDDIDDTIFELREQGIDYIEISKKLKKQGIKLKPFMVEERCKVIYKRKNMEEPDSAFKEEMEAKEKDEKEAKKKQLKEVIFELREKEKTYKEIQDYLFEKMNIKKCISDIRRIYLEYCKEIGIDEPRKRIISDSYKFISVQEVFNLRESGHIYREIVEYYEAKGIKTNIEMVRRIYIEECQRVGKKYISRVKLNKIKADKIILSDDEVFSLRERKLTYDDIVEYYKEKGVKVTKETIRKRCKRIYAEKGIEEPKAIRKISNQRKSIRFSIPDEEIVYLKEHGLTNYQIMEYYKQKGINIGIGNINKKCKEAYQKLGESRIPKNRGLSIIIPEDELYELREKNLSYAEIAAYYRKKEIQVSASTIENRCKEIYEKKGIKIQKRAKRFENELPEDLIIALKEKKYSFKKIAEFFKEKGIEVTPETIRKKYIKACFKRQKSLMELNNTLTNLLEKKVKTEQLLNQFTGLLSSIESKKEDNEYEK